MKKKISLKELAISKLKKADKIKVTRFLVTPAKNVKPGTIINIKMTIKNVSNKIIKCIPWQIIKNKEILYYGVRNEIPPGESFTISCSWKAIKGNYFFYGDADPKNILQEPKIKQINNLPQGKDVVIK
jgi:ribosomal 50S subunit-recycling heat shock protein